jgi:hypothetical protein
LQTYVSSVFRGMFRLCFLDVCSKCVCLYVAYVFTHILHVFYLDVAYGCNGFQVCFRCFFQVFQKHFLKCFNCLQTYVTTVVFGCLKSRSGVASLLTTICCIVSPGAGRASTRRRAQVLLNWRRRAPFPSCRSGGVAPHATRNERGAAQHSEDLWRGRDGGLAEGARLRWQRGGGMGVWRR